MNFRKIIGCICAIYDSYVKLITRFFQPWLIPTLARLVFVGVLLVYFWGSAYTKLGEGITGIFCLSIGAYAQMFPVAMENSGYDPSQLGFHYVIIALFGTWSEFILPGLILVGFLTRLASIGMIGFIFVQSLVDITGHNLSDKAVGNWFDSASDSLIFDQRAFWVFLLLVLILRGAGPISVDHALRPKKSDDR